MHKRTLFGSQNSACQTFLCNSVEAEKLPILLILLLVSLAPVLSSEWNSRSSRKLSGSLLSWEIMEHHIPALKLVQLSAYKLDATAPCHKLPPGGKKMGKTFHSFLVNTAQKWIPAAGRRCPGSPLTRIGKGAMYLEAQSWSFIQDRDKSQR